MAVGALAHPASRYKVGGRWRRKWSDERGIKEKKKGKRGRPGIKGKWWEKGWQGAACAATPSFVKSAQTSGKPHSFTTTAVGSVEKSSLRRAWNG